MTRSISITSHPVTVRRHTRSSRIALAIAALVVLGIPTTPFWAGSGQVQWVIELSCYVAMAQMWNLLAGYAGLVSIGQQAFVGAGGYSVFILAINFDLNPFWAVPLAGLLPAIIAFFAYMLLRRLDGPYFAIGTWVFAETLRLLAANIGYVNGGMGMYLNVMAQYTPHQREIGWTLLCASLLVLTVGGSYWLLSSRLGLALTAVRDDPIAAASQGVNVNRMRFMIWIVAAIGTGITGAVYYEAQLRITPDSGFDLYWSAICIFIVMVGGIGRLEGPIIGALLYFFATRLFGEYGAAYLVVLGLLTLAVALYAPTGLWGLLTRVRDWPWFPLRRTLVRGE